ncbi:hypothetical protein [Rheinheimera sp.]|uniref:hypothetical protein n=1 Tax=Rheinheimera sp. TaxID=1869214 RepID=UPI002FDC92F7
MNILGIFSGLLAFCCALLTIPAGAAQQPNTAASAKNQARTVIYGSPLLSAEQTAQMYPFKLLQAALKASGGNYQLKPANLDMVQGRVLKEIELGNVDVYWSMTSVDREKRLLPVRIPLDKGLNGWRLLLLAADQADIAEGVHSLKGLKRLSFLQGYDWPDTEILRFNQLKVLTAPHPQQLFDMLARHRGNAFPRSVIEIEHEQQHNRQGFVVEPDLVIRYPSAVYFFLNKTELQLAADLERGLHILRKNGQFDQLFSQRYGAAIQKARLEQRRIIELKNPLLPPETPLSDRSLWYQPPQSAVAPAKMTKPDVKHAEVTGPAAMLPAQSE